VIFGENSIAMVFESFLIGMRFLLGYDAAAAICSVICKE